MFNTKEVSFGAFFLTNIIALNGIQTNALDHDRVLRPKLNKFDGNIFGGPNHVQKLPASLESLKNDLYSLELLMDGVDITKVHRVGKTNGVAFVCQQVG